MGPDSEVIALFLDEPNDVDSDDFADSTGAHRLVREPDGRVALERVETPEDFDRIARDTGCFRRGRAIRDPRTLEVIGYEMEDIGPRPIGTPRGIRG